MTRIRTIGQRLELALEVVFRSKAVPYFYARPDYDHVGFNRIVFPEKHRTSTVFPVAEATQNAASPRPPLSGLLNGWLELRAHF